MATRRVSPAKRGPSLVQLADQAVQEAFGQSFDKFLRAVCEYHPHNHSYVRQFFRAWRAKAHFWRRVLET